MTTKMIKVTINIEIPDGKYCNTDLNQAQPGIGVEYPLCKYVNEEGECQIFKKELDETWNENDECLVIKCKECKVLLD